MIQMKDSKQIGLFIQERMKELNMKSSELSEQLALAKGKGYEKNQFRDLVYKWTHGQRVPGIDYIFYLSQILKVSIEELLVAGEVCNKYENRPFTLYSIVKSNNFEQLDYVMNLSTPDGSIVGDNYDEYDKTILDYAVEFENLEMIKYLLKKEYISFTSPYTITTRIHIGGQCSYTEMQNKILYLAIKYDDLDLFTNIISQNTSLWLTDVVDNNRFAKTPYNEGYGITHEVLEKILMTNKILGYLTSSYVSNLSDWNKINRGIQFVDPLDKRKILNQQLAKIERMPEGYNLILEYSLTHNNIKIDEILKDAIRQKNIAIKQVSEFYKGDKVKIDMYGNVKIEGMYKGSLSMIGQIDSKVYKTLDDKTKNLVSELVEV